MVDRQVGTTLTPNAWKDVIGEEQEEVAVAVRYLQGQADPSVRKVVERLLRVSERNKEIQLKETWRSFRFKSGHGMEQLSISRYTMNHN